MTGAGRAVPPLWFLGATCLAALTLIWPFTQALFLPLKDLPNHIARHAIMAEAPAGGALGDYYTTRFVLVPNSAADLLWRLSGYAWDPIVFSHRVMAFTALNLFASGLVLARVVHGRWTGWSLAGGLLVFNCTFLFGFQNYSVSLPFAIYAFALFLVTEQWKTHRRVLLFAPIAAVLFIMHFFAFAILGAMAFGREAQKLWEARDKGAALGMGALTALPFLLPLVWLAFDMTTGPENPAGSYTSFGTLAERVQRLMSPLHAYPTDITAEMNGTALLILGGLYALLATLLLPLRGGLSLAPVMRGPVIVLLLLVFLAPDWLSGVALIGIRFAFVFLLVAIAARRPPELSPVAATVALAMVLAVLGLRGQQVGTYFSAHDRDMRDLAALIDAHVEPGDRLLPVRAPGAYANSRLWHVQGYATARRSAFIPTLFQGVHAVQLRPQWAHHATPLMTANPACALFPRAPAEPSGPQESFCVTEPYVEGWSGKFDKVLAMEPLSDDLADGAPLAPLGRMGRFEIYAVEQRMPALPPGS